MVDRMKRFSDFVKAAKTNFLMPVALRGRPD